jgi:hypothetical protein
MGRYWNGERVWIDHCGDLFAIDDAETVAGVNSRVVLVHSFANCLPSTAELDQKGAIWHWDSSNRLGVTLPINI